MLSDSPCLPGGSCPSHRSACPALLPGCELQSYACSSPKWLCGSLLHSETGDTLLDLMFTKAVLKLVEVGVGGANRFRQVYV